MGCDGCGAQNREDATFCASCGAALSLRCSSCARELAADARFCDGCGTPVAAAGSAPAAVRKTVTAMFCDLGGSTGFGERVDAESARSVIGRYHSMLQAVVDAHGGTVAKFIGDGMLAFFGIPEVAEDDAERSVAAAAEMQRRFGAFADEVADRHGEVLTFRIGVNSGEVVIGEGDADIVGDALNVAARLEKACEPGRVLVGEATWRLTRGAYAFEALGAVAVAGRAESVSAYVVVDDTTERSAEATPFVGRDDELARLQATLDDAVATQKARFVTVIGPPGVGKTRLSRELEQLVAGEATVLHTACERSGAATFAPLVDLIRPTIGLVEDLDDEATRAKLAGIVPPEEPARERERIVDGLAGIVGVGEARSTEETFWAVRRLIESLAATQPLILVIDDIQWAESLLLDLLEHLAEWVSDAAVLVVGLARPELRDLRPAMAEPGRRMADVIVLDGLDADATAQLAARMLGGGGLPAELLARLPASTDGNPLFVRELVRMLVDEEIIRRDGDTWRLTVDVEAVEVPPTIRSLLAARIERLPAAERNVLERASVIGADFTLGGLRSLVDDQGAVEGHLERLRRRDLVEPTGSYWGDDPQYRFHHVLIRDAVYGRLLKEARADLHERIGEWTEEAAARVVGEYGPAIAHHYEQAHEYLAQLGALDDHGRALGRRAAELLTSSSERALERDDLVAAGSLATRALACLEDEEHRARADLLLLACEAVLASGDLAPAPGLVDDLALVGAQDDRLAAWADTYRAQLLDLTDPGRLDEAESLAVAAADRFAALGDRSGQAKAHLVRAGLMARRGRIADSEAELDRALSAARDAGDQRRLVAVLGVAPSAALWGPSPVARAGGRCLDVIRLLRITAASPAVEATSTRHQAVLEALRGRFDTARSLLASARSTVEELGLRRDLMEVELFTGIVELLAQDPAAAEGPLRTAQVGLADMGVGSDAALAAAHLARALLAQGRMEEAEALAAEAQGAAGQGLKAGIAWRSVRARLLAAADDADGAVTLAEEAVALAEDTDLLLDHADAWAALAEVRTVAGDGAGATTARVEADRLYGLKGSTVHGAPPAPPVGDATVSPEHNPSSAVEVENRASQRSREIVARWMEDGPEGVRDLVSERVLWEDRRRGLGAVTEGRDARIEGLRAVTEIMGESTYEIFEVVAQRGERLTLTREGVIGDFVVVNLGLSEFDDAGLQCRLTQFDPDDLPAALEEMDARYLAGEGAAHARVVAVQRAWIAASVARDWDAVTALFTPEFRVLDHRALGFGALGREEWVQHSRSRFDLTEDVVMWSPWFQIDGPVISMVIAGGGTGPGGTEVEWSSRGVLVTDLEQGVWISGDVYAGDDAAGAQARFDELTAAGATGGPAENRAYRPESADLTAALAERDAAPLASEGAEPDPGENMAARRGRAFVRKWMTEGAEALRDMMAEDIRYVDRRPGLGDEMVGRDAVVDNLRTTSEVLVDVPFEVFDVVAQRGDRLALFLQGVQGEYEVKLLSVIEFDAEGRQTLAAHYEPSAMTAAMAEMEQRYLAGGGAESRSEENLAAGWGRAFVDRWMTHGAEATRALMVEDVRFDDRREGLGHAAVGADAVADNLAAMSSLIGGDRFEVFEVVAYRGDLLALFDQGIQGEFEIRVFTLAEFTPDGRQRRYVTYGADDLAAALGLLDEWFAEGEGADRAAELEVGRRVGRAIAEGDSERLAAMLTDDFATVDHRPLGWGVRDQGTFLAAVAARPETLGRGVMVNPTFRRLEPGGLLGPFSIRTRSADGTEGLEVGIVLLLVRDGRLARMETFDEHAVEEAEARFDALLADPQLP